MGRLTKAELLSLIKSRDEQIAGMRREIKSLRRQVRALGSIGAASTVRPKDSFVSGIDTVGDIESRPFDGRMFTSPEKALYMRISGFGVGEEGRRGAPKIVDVQLQLDLDADAARDLIAYVLCDFYFNGAKVSDDRAGESADRLIVVADHAAYFLLLCHTQIHELVKLSPPA